jgi:hypothetical protein
VFHAGASPAPPDGVPRLRCLPPPPPPRSVSVPFPLIHDVTVTSGSSLNVVQDSRGANLNLDMHRWAPRRLQPTPTGVALSSFLSAPGFGGALSVCVCMCVCVSEHGPCRVAVPGSGVPGAKTAVAR